MNDEFTRELMRHIYILIKNEKQKLEEIKEQFNFNVEISLFICVNLFCNLLDGFNNVEIQKSFALDFIKSLAHNAFEFIELENKDEMMEKINININ